MSVQLLPGTLRSRTPLSEVARVYENTNFIAEEILPTRDVMLKEASGLVWDPKRGMTRRPLVRAEDGKLPRSKMSVKSDSYTTEFNGHEILIDSVEQSDIEQEYDISMQIEAGVELREIFGRDREEQTAALVDNPANYRAQNVNLAADDWNNPAADIIGSIIEPLHAAVHNGCGKMANVARIPFEKWLSIGKVTQVREHLLSAFGPNAFQAANDGSAIPTAQALAVFFKVKKVIIGDALIDGNPEGDAEDFTPIWSRDKFGMHYQPSVALRKEPSLGLTYSWRPWSGPLSEPMIWPVYKEESSLSELVRATRAIGPQVREEGRAGALAVGINGGVD